MPGGRLEEGNEDFTRHVDSSRAPKPSGSADGMVKDFLQVFWRGHGPPFRRNEQLDHTIKFSSTPMGLILAKTLDNSFLTGFSYSIKLLAHRDFYPQDGNKGRVTLTTEE
ncbi:MAG TPA: hypothetical protein VFQ60_02585 [Patescibacteria group bacterium]|nr:hypothetical protein [Patescibacteria group bacterium]